MNFLLDIDSLLLHKSATNFKFEVMLLLFIFTNSLQITTISAKKTQLPNFLIILTDDQDLLLDGLLPMRKTREIIGNNGRIFTNAFVNSPICCPSRSTILTGHYPHNLMVWNNSRSGNCSSQQWQTNFEPNSIGALLKFKRNYTTFYAGKYLNQYGMEENGGISHIPLGYDWWIGLKGNSRYYNYTLSINGTGQFIKNQYLTDKIAEYSLEFLNQNFVRFQQFLMILAPPAAHAPFTPAPQYQQHYRKKKTIRNPSFNYSAHDKHWLVQMPPKYLPENITILDEIQRNRLRTLLSVDDMIETITMKLQQLQIIDNTYLIFLSDNGYHIGQFTQPWDKRQPYQTDIHIPFMIRGPNIPKKTICKSPIATVDLTPTIIDLVGIDYRKFDGQSFKKQLFDLDCDNNNNRLIFIEYYGESNAKSVDRGCNFTKEDMAEISECTLDNWCKCQDSKNNTYRCLIDFTNHHQHATMKFCHFIDDDDFYEIYNLTNDPYELENLYHRFDDNKTETNVIIKNYRKLLEKFQNCKESNCLIET